MYRTSTTRWREASVTRLFFTAAMLAIAACSHEAGGPPRTEQRGVDLFHSIDLRGAIDATVQAGSRPSVTLVADSDTLKAIRTRVENGMLIVDMEAGKQWLSDAGRIEAHITLPTLNALAMNGAGKVTITGIDSGALALALQGAGSISASGKSATLNARVNGAGSMDVSSLVAGDASVVVNGAGELKANVTGALQATVNGVGSITYAGKPQKVDSQIHGVGRIVSATQPGS
jgi:hypothetical protein